MEQKTLGDELRLRPSLDPKTLSPQALRRPAILTCPSAYDGESSIPPIAVGHYVLMTGSNRDWWDVGDTFWESRDSWLVGAELPYDYRSNRKGPHDGGFNVADSDGSVDLRVP
jgi:hypothetical protein